MGSDRDRIERRESATIRTDRGSTRVPRRLAANEPGEHSSVSPIHLRRRVQSRRRAARERVLEAACAVALAAGLVLGLASPEPVAAQTQSSQAAKDAQGRAWDESAPGPKQPIPFSHALHAGQYQMDCLYCHSGTDKSMAAGVPSVELCMGCHAQFGQDLEGVQILKKHWDDKQTVEWQQIHRLPEYVQFRHNRHIAAGVACQTCHGQIQQMDKVAMTSDTIWWPWLLPSKKLEMGWCINCHRQNQASTDCLTCHY